MILAEVSDDSLKDMSTKLHDGIVSAKRDLKAVNEEISFRQHLAQRSKALEGLSPEQLARIGKLTQGVAPKGIASNALVGEQKK